MTNPKRFTLALWVILAVALLPFSGWAQTATGIVSGIVKDATGAVIPGVEVTITNTATNLGWTGISNDAGIFRISNVPPGPYRAEAALTGFKTARADFDLDVAGHQTLNFTLEIGDIAEVVEVAGAVQKVSTEESTLSSVVQERQVQDLPLNGRNVFQLARLQPGITVGYSDGIGVGGAEFTASGNRVRGNNFSLDGTSNNDPITGGAPALTPNLDTVQEFRIQNNNFSAEYGRNNGAVVNVITKSGTNEPHGTLFWYHRNDALDAREVFDPVDKKIPPLRQHQAGFTIGGPIVRDRTFFFFGFEAFRVFSGETSLVNVETPEFRNLVNQQFPGTLPALLLKTYPAPAPTTDIRDLGSPSTGFFSPGPKDGIPDRGEVATFSPDLFKRYQYNLRIDHELTEKNRLFGRWTWEDQDSPANNIRNDELGSDFDGHDVHGLVSSTHIFSPTVVNEFRFGYAKDESNFDVPRFDITDFNIFGFLGQGITGFGAYGGIPQFFTAEEYHLVDVVSINAGNHGVRTGFEYRWNQDDSDFQFLTRGYVGYSGIFDFAANLPYEVSMRIRPGQGALPLVGTPHNFRQSEVGWFIQDDWRIHQRFTLNLGLRYDNYGLIDDLQGQLANLILGDGRDVFERVMNGRVDAVSPEGVIQRDNNNFAPRIGFAWDLFGDGRTSLRSGFGVAYDRLFLNVTGNIRFNPPLSANLGLYPFQLFRRLGASPTAVSRWLGDNLSIPFKVPSGVQGRGFNAGGGPLLGVTLPGSTTEVELGGPISLRAPDPTMRSSYSMNWFFGIQRELPWDMLFEANYVGNGGRKLGFIEQYNRFNGDRFGLPNPYNGAFANSRAIDRLNEFFTSESLRTNNINSSYHGGNVSLQKRFSQGLSFQAAYTFGKVLDYGSDNFSSNAGSIFTPNPGRIDLEKGKASFDVPKRFVTNFIYEIPFLKQQEGALGQVLGGWQIQSIITVQDGTPYTPQAFSSAHDYNGDGRNNDRPDAPASVDQFKGLSVQKYIRGVFGDSRSDAHKHFNTNGLPGDCEGNGRVGGPTGAATFNGKSCIGIGTMGRSLFRGPGFASTDFSLFKHFRIPWFTQEDARLQFRAEFFNFFNRVNLSNVNRSFTSSVFGRSRSALDAREIQFALKLLF